MSQKTKATLAAGLATISIAAAPLASLAINGGAAGIPVACAGSGGSGCAG
jgi:hypothetical protein